MIMWNNRKFRLRKITYIYATYDDGGGIDTVEIADMIVSVDWMKYPTITRYELHNSWVPEWVREEFPEDEQPLTDRQLFSKLKPYYLPPELREKEPKLILDDDLPFN
jgi:hypothetical protein